LPNHRKETRRAGGGEKGLLVLEKEKRRIREEGQPIRRRNQGANRIGGASKSVSFPPMTLQCGCDSYTFSTLAQPGLGWLRALHIMHQQNEFADQNQFHRNRWNVYCRV